MKTYKFRFKFHVASRGKLQGEENKYNFALPNGKNAELSCMDAAKFSEASKFVVTSGGYCSEEEAYACAEQFKESVLCFSAKFRMGVDIGKDKASGFIGKSIKDEMLKGGVRIVDDVHGISVFDEEYPIACGSISSIVLVNSRECKFFADEICNLMSSQITAVS